MVCRLSTGNFDMLAMRSSFRGSKPSCHAGSAYMAILTASLCLSLESAC